MSLKQKDVRIIVAVGGELVVQFRWRGGEKTSVFRKRDDLSGPVEDFLFRSELPSS